MTRLNSFCNWAILSASLFAAIAATSAAAEQQHATTAAAPNPPQQVHAIAMHGEPLLAEGFQHSPHVNPQAPKGGMVRLGILGSYDSFNPLIIKGVAAAGLRDFVHESLLARGLDEPFTLYGLLAERIEVPDDRSAITFHLNERAKFSDGHAVDAEDILFSWKTLRDHGRPNHRAYYKKVTKAERLSDRSVRFELEPGDRELPLILGLMPVLPSHLITEDSFQLTTLNPPVGSGPYTISRVDPGRSLIYSRNPDWWGKDLPINRGRFNFDEIRYEYFRDDAAMLEAFKSGKIDVRVEEDPSRWAEGYGEPNKNGLTLSKIEFDIGLPSGMNALVFNTRRPIFANPNVREALIQLFDFAWINKNLYHGLYKRTQSYFDRSELSSIGRPADDRERAFLKPYPNAVAPAIMDGTFKLPTTDGTGRNRKIWRKALALLKGAGYQLKSGKLINAETGKQLSFELLAGTTINERLFLSFARDLEKLGIAARVRVVDSAQYQSRIKTYDYDMIQTRWPSSLSPGNEQIFRWSSKMADRDGTFNFAGVKNPAADAMIEAMLSAREAEDFKAAVHALDRVLLSGHYVVPLFHLPKQWVALWSNIRYPKQTSLFGYQLDTWWAKQAENSAK